MSLPISIQSAWAGMLLVTLPLLFWLSARSGTRLGRKHLRVATLLRSLAIIALALALMRPQWTAQSSDLSVVYALDVSRSVSAAFIDGAIAWIERADREGAPAQARYLAFADHAVMVQKAEDLRAVAVTQGDARAATPAANVIDRSATDLEQALDVALTGLDRDHAKRIVLLTDGNENAGDIWRVLPRLKQAHVRVFAIPATVREANDAWIAGIEAPADIHAGEPVSIIVQVVSGVDTPGEVRLANGNIRLGSRKLALKAGLNRITFDARLTRAGAATLSAEVVVKGDTVIDNNLMHQSLWVKSRPRVLLVEGGKAEGARQFADALTGQGFDVRIIAPDAFPAAAAGLAAYEAIVLSDTSAKALAMPAMTAIESYVRDLGGGLLFASGENVHGEQGYSDTPVEQVLPVQFRAQEKRKDLTLVIALDRSYSMKGRKMEMAKEATRAALDLLEEQHRFAVVAFDSQAYIAVPMQYVRSRRKAQDQISRIQASGQTNIYPALGIVYRLLQKTDSKAKHVILLSDGDTHPADFESLVKRMVAEKMVVSTVAVGADADRVLMSDIAKWGKGRAYVAETAESIPQIFIEETQRAVRSNLLEESFRPVVKRRSAAFRGMDVDRLPDLNGFVSSKARDHVEVLLATPSGAPLLARWQYGLGKAVVFTSDVTNRWSSQWIEWPGYGKFWAQQVRDVMRRDSGERLDFRVVREGAEIVVRLAALTPGGDVRNGLAPRVRMTRNDRSTSVIGLSPAGAGTYELRMPVDRSMQAERFELVDSPGISKADVLRAGSRTLHQDFANELRAFPPDMELLGALTHATGGKIAPAMAEVFSRQGDESRTIKDLWPWFSIMALMFYLLDIAARRSPLAWRWLES
jgi:uncharacterized membrane protein